MVKNKISLQLLGFIAGALLIFDGTDAAVATSATHARVNHAPSRHDCHDCHDCPDSRRPVAPGRRSHRNTSRAFSSPTVGVVGIFFGSAFGLDAVHVLLEMVMVFVGFVVLMIEGADKLCTPDNEGVAWCQLYRGKLFHFARFLFVPIGRGYFYLYISVMLLAQYPDPVDLGVFFYMFFFTIFCLNVGYQVECTLPLHVSTVAEPPIHSPYKPSHARRALPRPNGNYMSSNVSSTAPRTSIRPW